MIRIFLFMQVSYPMFLDFTAAICANWNLDAERESCSSRAARRAGQRSHLFSFDFTPILA
jgi:hypothetical protein